MSPHPRAPMSDETPPAKPRSNRKDWGLAVIVASVLTAMVLAALYLSYEKNPWVGASVPWTSPWATQLNGSAGQIELWLNDERWIMCRQEEISTVNDAKALLMDTYPKLAKPSANLRAVSLYRWNLFDARRIGPRFAELIEPVLNNDYWSAPSFVIEWFGADPAYVDCFHVACMDEKRLATMDIQPGDMVFFQKE